MTFCVLVLPAICVDVSAGRSLLVFPGRPIRFLSGSLNRFSEAVGMKVEVPRYSLNSSRDGIAAVIADDSHNSLLT